MDDEDGDETTGSRAQYVSANCVVFTHYQGDAASVVDEHFSRALDKTSTHAKGNFLKSFSIKLISILGNYSS